MVSPTCLNAVSPTRSRHSARGRPGTHLHRPAATATVGSLSRTILVRRRRKTLIVCQSCHTSIHRGQPVTNLMDVTGEPGDRKAVTPGSGGGRRKRTNRYLACVLPRLSPMPSSDSASSSCVPTSPIPARFGQTSGRSARHAGKDWLSPSWPTASLPALSRPACRPSAIASARLICRPSSIAG